jgi:hypothetical protein
MEASRGPLPYCRRHRMKFSSRLLVRCDAVERFKTRSTVFRTERKRMRRHFDFRFVLQQSSVLPLNFNSVFCSIRSLPSSRLCSLVILVTLDQCVIAYVLCGNAAAAVFDGRRSTGAGCVDLTAVECNCTSPVARKSRSPDLLINPFVA